jgi:hypothetical protein
MRKKTNYVRNQSYIRFGSPDLSILIMHLSHKRRVRQASEVPTDARPLENIKAIHKNGIYDVKL